jgi:hypothetical protein
MKYKYQQWLYLNYSQRENNTFCVQITQTSSNFFLQEHLVVQVINNFIQKSHSEGSSNIWFIIYL